MSVLTTAKPVGSLYKIYDSYRDACWKLVEFIFTFIRGYTEAKKFIPFCETRGKTKELLHSLPLALTLTFNHFTNDLLQATTMFYGLKYLTYGSATEHKYLNRCATNYERY